MDVKFASLLVNDDWSTGNKDINIFFKIMLLVNSVAFLLPPYPRQLLL